MMRRLIPALTILVLTCAPVFPSSAQENSCPALVEAALSASEAACAATGRNEACYGHLSVNAELAPNAGNVSFAQTGDIISVTALRTLRLSPLDVSAGIWGVALMRLQANLPDTLPGQNVNFLVFGNTEITNAVAQETELNVTTPTGGIPADVYISPDETSAVVGRIQDEQELVAVGRTQNADWVLVELPDSPDSSGWLPASRLRAGTDLTALPVIEPGAPRYGPMQSFYLRTGISEPECAEAPPDGILAQTPEGVGTVTLAINQVEVAFGSTLFFRAQPDGDMILSVLEGAARAAAQGVSRPAVAGGRIRIPLNENLEPESPPSDFEPYDEVFLAPLPVDRLERPISIAPSVTQEEADRVMRFERYFNLIAVSDFNALHAFLNDNPQAENAEIEAFLQTLGYVF